MLCLTRMLCRAPFVRRIEAGLADSSPVCVNVDILLCLRMPLRTCLKLECPAFSVLLMRRRTKMCRIHTRRIVALEVVELIFCRSYPSPVRGTMSKMHLSCQIDKSVSLFRSTSCPHPTRFGLFYLLQKEPLLPGGHLRCRSNLHLVDTLADHIPPGGASSAALVLSRHLDSGF